MEADSGGADSSAEKHALTKMFEKICITFPIETAHPALISCYVIDYREKDEIFQNNPSRFNRVSALLNIISRDVQIEDYRRFKNFLIVLQKTSNCKFLLQGLQQHLQRHRQRVRTSLSSERIEELQADLFTKNRSYLTQRLNPSDIVDHLISYRLVGHSAGQEISSPYHADLHRNGLIVNELSRGQPETVEKFCEILRKSQRTKYIADKLEKDWRELLQSEDKGDQCDYGPSPPQHIGPDMSSSRLGQGTVGPNLRSGQGAGYHIPPAPHSAQGSGSSTISTMNMELMQKYVIPNLAEHWSAISDFLEYPLQVKKKFSYGHAKDCARALLKDWINTDNGRKPKTWSMFLQVLNEFGESEGEPVVNVTRWVVQRLVQEGVLEIHGAASVQEQTTPPSGGLFHDGQRLVSHNKFFYSPQFPRKASTDPPQMKQGYLKVDQPYVHRSSEDIQYRGQEEHYQATPHGGGHISSTTTSDTFPEAAWKQPSTHPQAKKQEEQWQQYYQSHCPPGGRMSSTNTSEVFGDDQTRAIPPGSYNPNVTPQHPLHKVHHSSLPNYNRQSSIDQPVDRRRTASDVPQSTRPMNNYGHSQHETRPATVQEGQPLERNLYHEFTEPDGSQTKHQQQQYSSGDRRARHQPPPQHLGQYDTWHGPHPQDQQIVQSSQQGSPRPSPPRPPPPRPPPPQQQEQHQLYEGQYGRQQNLPQAQDLNTAAQPGLPSSQAQGNIQSRQQPHPSMYQPTTAHQILQQPQVATTPQFPVISVIQVDQQIHIHQQKLFELQQLQQQMLLRQQYEQLLQVQQQVQLESQKLQQVLTFRRQLQQPPQTEQQWKPNLQSQHLQTQQPGEPPQQHGYHQKQSDNRQTVGDQPEQQFSHQATGHDVYQSHQRPPPAPNQPVNLIQPNDHQITMHGTQQGTTHDREQDTMYEAQQGTSQWGTTYVAQHTSTTTTQSQFPPQEQASRPGQSSQHKPTSEACYMEDVQTQLQHKLTIQEHQTTTEPNVDGRIPPPHQPTGSTQQKHTQSSMVSSHEKRSQIDILKDELKILEEKQQVMEQLRKLQEQINNQSSQGEILQAKGNQLTEVGFSHEESQGDSQQGNSIHSPVTCQHDRESQELLYSEQSSNTAFQSLAITCQPLIDSQDAKYHGDAASSLQKDGPPRRATSSGVSHQDTEKNDGIPPATVTPTNIAAPFTSSVTHTPSTTSGEVITDNATPVAGTSVVTTTTTRLHSTSSVSSTASGSSHVDSEVHGTDEKTTSSSATTSTASGTTTSDRSATHSHSTINILFVKPSTTAQSGTTDPVTTVSLFSTMTASLSSSASTDSRVSQSDQQEQSVTNESTLSPTTDTSVLSTTTNMVSATQAYSTSSSLSSSATNTIMGEEIDTDDAPKNLKKGDHLGSGSFGKVYKCFCKDTGEEIAAKVIEIHPNLAEKELVSLEKEINMLKDLQHDRIVVYHGTRRSKTSVEIYMEYMPGGSLRKFLKDHGVLNENLTRKYTRQLLEGVVYLHSQNIVHRDIKGDNVLRDSKGNVKIADFGTCKRIQTIYLSEVKASTVAGTYHWMAPEVFKCEPSTIKSDVWSVGCTVFEMLTGNPPYYELGQYQLIFLVGNDDPMDIKLPSHCSNVVHDFVTTCLRKNASSRPTAEELLCHEFLNPSLPHCASAAPKLVTAKPSTKQPVAEHTTVTTTHGSAIQQSTPDADPTDQALSATNATSTKGTSTTAERNIANNQSLTKHPVPCTSVTADNAKKWSAVHHPTLESSSDHQVTTDQSPLTTGTDTSEDYTDSDNIMDNNSGGKQLPKTVASPSNTDKHKRPSLHLQMRKMSDSKAAIVEMVSDIPSTPISESTPVVKKYYIMNHPQFHVTDYKGCQLISMTNTGQQFPIDFPKGVNFNLLQPYSEDIINGINVNTIVPPMLAHGLLTPEHCEYFFNPHVISTEKQRKLGFLIITLSEECAQKYLQCLKNTRDYAPHGALLKKIEDGLKSSEK